jgi:two-component system sensor histidine kinase/response regulator
LDGFEATAAIREAEKINGKHIPIVAITAHALKGDQDRCIVAGMDGYVSKPIRSMELFALMGRLLAPIQPPILLFNGLAMFGLLFTVREMIDFAA